MLLVVYMGATEGPQIPRSLAQDSPNKQASRAVSGKQSIARLRAVMIGPTLRASRFATKR